MSLKNIDHSALAEAIQTFVRESGQLEGKLSGTVEFTVALSINCSYDLEDVEVDYTPKVLIGVEDNGSDQIVARIDADGGEVSRIDAKYAFSNALECVVSGWSLRDFDRYERNFTVDDIEIDDIDFDGDNGLEVEG